MIGKIVMRGALLGAVFMGVLGCAGSPAKKPGKRTGLEALPPMPDGWVVLPSESTGFRSARIQTPGGRWVVNFEDGITKVETSPYVVTKLDPKWYPEEGGADAALCRGYQSGNSIMIRLEGSSDFKSEETRIVFENRQLKEIIKYSVPGGGMGPENPGEWVPYDQRVMKEEF